MDNIIAIFKYFVPQDNLQVILGMEVKFQKIPFSSFGVYKRSLFNNGSRM